MLGFPEPVREVAAPCQRRRERALLNYVLVVIALSGSIAIAIAVLSGFKVRVSIKPTMLYAHTPHFFAVIPPQPLQSFLGAGWGSVNDKLHLFGAQYLRVREWPWMGVLVLGGVIIVKFAIVNNITFAARKLWWEARGLLSVSRYGRGPSPAM